SRRAVAVVTQREDGSLPAVEAIDRRRQLRTPLAGQHRAFRVALAAAQAGDPRFIGARDVARDEPAIAACARLAPIQTAVDENPREPDLERPGLAIRRDMGKDLDERVLDRFVGFG